MSSTNQGTATPADARSASKPLPWFRVYHEIIDDDKLGLVAFEDRWHYVAILACKARGLLDKADARDMMFRRIALKMGVAARELDEIARRLAEVGLIDRETLQPLAWDERQMRSDSSTERTRKYREKQRAKGSEKGVTGVKRHSDGLDTDTDTDTEIEKEEKSPADAAFDHFWAAGMVKTGRKAARKAFDVALKREKRAPAEFAAMLAKDVKDRIDHKQFGFDSLHPSTYLNGNRWEDALPPAQTRGSSQNSLTSQQRSFKGKDYGESRGIDSWLEDEAANQQHRQAEGAV